MEDKILMTVHNQRVYQHTEYDTNDIILKKSVVIRETLALDRPETRTYNIRLDEVQTQDNIWQILPLDNPTYNAVNVYLANI